MSGRVFSTAFVTGSAGSGGSYKIEHILKNHPEIGVCGTLKPPTAFFKSQNIKAIRGKVQFVECDFNDILRCKKILDSVRPDVIFHFASDANVRESFDRPAYEIQNNVNACGTNFFEAIFELKEKDLDFNPVIVHCSTSEVYGQVLPYEVPIKETQPMRGKSSPYGRSKVLQDRIAETYSDWGLKIIRTRMFTYVSPRRKNIFSTAFAMQVARVEAGLQSELVHGNLDSVRTILDVRDAMEAYWVAGQKCNFGEAYNIGGKKQISVGEFLELLKSKAKCGIPSRVNSELVRPSDVTLQIPDTSKFERETGWFPKCSFEETVDYLLEYCRKEVATEVLK